MAPQAPMTPAAFEKAIVSPSSVHYDRVMADQSLACIQDADGFVAGQVFPNKDVQDGSAVFPSYDRSYFLRHRIQKVPVDGVAPTVTHGMSWDKRYDCEVWKTRVALPKEILARQSVPVDIENEAVTLLTNHGLVFKDEIWCEKFFAAGLWDTDQTGVNAGPGANQFLQWDDSASTPINDVLAQRTAFRKATGKEARVGVIGREVHDALLTNPQIVARVINNNGNAGVGRPVMPDTETIRVAFGLEKLIVANAIHDVGQEGKTLATDFIAGKNFGLFHVPPSVGVMTPIPGQTFSWAGYNPGMNEMGMGFRRYFNEERETWYVEMTLAFDMKLVASYLAKLFVTCIP